MSVLWLFFSFSALEFVRNLPLYYYLFLKIEQQRCNVLAKMEKVLFFIFFNIRILLSDRVELQNNGFF